jgi:peptidoglycan/LPS O-acetylase OafA/YrhL
LWSISLEAQFYLVIPFVARLRRRTIALLCALVIAASYIFLLHFGRARFSPVLQAWPNTIIQFQFFAAGAAIALVLFRRHFAPGLFLRAALALAGLTLFYVAAIVCRIHSIRPIPTIHLLTGYLCELTGIIAIFLAVLHLPLKVASPLAYLGKISYGLYLFHAPLLWFAFSSTGPLSPSLLANRHPATTVLLVAAATIALAALSYEFFEKPILRLKQRFESEKTRI